MGNPKQLFAVRDIKTDKLISNLSGKKRTFYQRKKMVEDLLESYVFWHDKQLNDFEIVVYNLVEDSSYQLSNKSN